MAQKAPGKSYRKRLTLLEIADMFRDEADAKVWIAQQRWPNGPECPYCRISNVQSDIKHMTMMYRCRECPNSLRRRRVLLLVPLKSMKLLRWSCGQ